MDKIVNREIVVPVKKHLAEKEITLIHGARQVGKTTLLMTLMAMLKQELHVPDSQILYSNLDLFHEYEKWHNQQEFIRYLQEICLKQSMTYLFVDEAQYLDEAGRYVKGIYDLHLPLKMVITGSSSLLLAHHTRESLMGRKQVFVMRSFSFREYLSHEKKELLDLLKTSDISLMNKNIILDELYHYLYFGGYPRVVLSKETEQKENYLKEIFSSYMDKDISQFLGIHNKIGFSRVVGVLADQMGSLVNVTEVANTCQISHQTVKRYLEALEGTYMISMVRPFSGNVRSELVKMPKVYFSDLGFRNIVIKGFNRSFFERDKGALLENFVYNELSRKWGENLHFWRLKDGTEVDFVIEKSGNEIIPVEVKATVLNKPTIPLSVCSFAGHYSSKDAYIVNVGMEKDVQEGNTTYHFILPWQLDKIQ